MGRKQRTQEELREASNHLYYEYEQLTGMARGLASGIAGKKSVIHNALLEAFTIHARVLLKFLYDEKPRPNDVIADDFFPTPQKWKEVRPEMTEILETIYGRVGKEVAHLTYDRQYITAEAKEWDCLQILRDMEVRLKKFLGIVQEELLGKRWEGLKERIRKMREST